MAVPGLDGGRETPVEQRLGLPVPSRLDQQVAEVLTGCGLPLAVADLAGDRETLLEPRARVFLE